MRTRDIGRFIAGSFALVVIGGCKDSTGPLPPPLMTAGLEIVNGYSRSLMFVNFTACETDSWGSDRLGGGYIAVGASRSWTVSPGCWDVRIVASDNMSWVNRGENIAAGVNLRLTAR